MYLEGQSRRLASGEVAVLGVHQAPLDGDAQGIDDLLAHKQWPWRQHIIEALVEPLGKLDTRFYVAAVGGRAVSNVMTLEHRGVGILGHVFTRPEYRRNGLCQSLFDLLLSDFRGRGGRQLVLGTGYDSPPYWIYHRNGFRPIVPDTGFMRLCEEPDFASAWFGPGPARVVPLQWHHWATMAQLFAEPVGDGMASWLLRFFGPHNFEGSFLQLFLPTEPWQGAEARVLETDTGAAVGFALLHRDNRWPGDVKILDVVTHPAHEAGLSSLLSALPLEGRIQSYLPASAHARRQALEAAGFHSEGVFPNQLGSGQAVVVLGRG